MSVQGSDLLQACVDQLLQYLRTVMMCNTRPGWRAQQCRLEHSMLVFYLLSSTKLSQNS